MGVTMIDALQIRAKLADVERRELALVDFESWIDVASWSMHRDSDADSIRLASRIHSLMADRDSGVLDQNAYVAALIALKEQISQAVDTFSVELVDHASHLWLVQPSACNSQFLGEQSPSFLATDQDVKITYSGSTMKFLPSFAFQQA